jgi:dihydroorotase
MNKHIKKFLADMEAKGYWVVPGLVDIHVHFRDPGLTHKEDIITGLRAAAAGGFTTVVTMANTNPVCDEKYIIKYQKKMANVVGLGRLFPICSVTKNMDGVELVDTKNFAYSDDGKQIHDAAVLESALQKFPLVLAHYDDPEHELMQRDIDLAIKHGRRLHIQHISTAKSVEVVRKARATHPHLITAEVAPHHFALTSDALKTHGTNAKMAPPLRTKKDVDAIIGALRDGTISVIATDHAPHTEEEKSVEFDRAPNGITGLETSVGLTLTHLYHTGILTRDQIVALMSTNPTKILDLKPQKSDFTIIDPNFEWVVDNSKSRSKSKNNPYHDMKLRGKVLYTICNGKIIYGTINT